MRRKLALLLALLGWILAVLPACGSRYAEEKATLQGTWQGEINVTEQANEELKDAYLAIIGRDTRRARAVLRQFDSLTLTIKLSVEPDGCYDLSVTEASVLDCFLQASDLTKGMVVEYCRNRMDAAGKDVLPEDMIEAADELLSRVDARMDPEQAARHVHTILQDLRQEGYCTINRKGLVLSEEAGGESHTICQYVMTDGTLTLEAKEGALPDFCPSELKKIF